ncbi:MAG: hypothetical protein ABF276_07945 [Sulfurovum sp.]
MNKQNFISVTLLVSALTFNPLVAKQQNINTSTQFEHINVTSSIASILHKRGLDEDAAQKISENFVNEEDEIFAMMIANLLSGCDSINKDEVMEYLSRVALHKQDIHLDNYAQLVHMLTTIKQKVLDKGTLTQLSVIAKQNALMLG